MEPTFLSEQIERMRAQLATEKDPATQREMTKTLHHLHREFRKATRHRHPWHGLKSNLIALVLIFFAIVLFCIFIERFYGWKLAGTAFSVSMGFFLLVSVTVFLAMQRIPPDIYAALVSTAMGSLPWKKGSNGEKKELPQPGAEPRKLLDGRTGEVIPTLEADGDSTSESDE
jgi:hypothetical protein